MVYSFHISREKRLRRDGRLTLILFFAYCFIIVFIISEIAPDKSGVGESQRYNLRAGFLFSDTEQNRQDSTNSQPLPTNLTPFFFKKLPVNSADKELLMTIKGVGPKLAESIIKSRTRSGPFYSSSDLLRVKGVGTKRVHYFDTVFSYKLRDDQQEN